MKRILFLAGVFALTLAPVPAATVSLVFSTTNPGAGDTFTVDVTVTSVFALRPPGDLLLAFGFDPFISNPAAVVFESATVDSLFNNDSGAFPDTAVSGSALLASGDFTAPLTLATLQFRALSIGPVSVGITSNLLDPNEGLIFLENVVAPGAEDLTSSTELNVVVPEPATPWLLSAFGVVAVLARKWKAGGNDPK